MRQKKQPEASVRGGQHQISTLSGCAKQTFQTKRKSWKQDKIFRIRRLWKYDGMDTRNTRFSNPFLGQERFRGVSECTAEEIDWTLNMQGKKTQNLVNVLLFDQKKKKMSRKNLKISKPSTVVREICMPQKEAGWMVYNSYLTWWAAGFGAKHFLIR